jgi:hypothetical protein
MDRSKLGSGSVNSAKDIYICPYVQFPCDEKSGETWFPGLMLKTVLNWDFY